MIKTLRHTLKYCFNIPVLSISLFSYAANAYSQQANFHPENMPQTHSASTSDDSSPAAWTSIVRKSPYWISKGAYNNLATIRRWVLEGRSYCEQPQRHILFDRQAQFLGYMDNEATSTATQEKLNQQREKIAVQKRVDYWLAGSEQSTGYPFALSCDQPHADLSQALARYTGEDADARLWGTWDGMRIGSKDKLVSLHEAINIVYHDRKKRQHISLPENVLATLAGTILIESGGRKKAHSNADARGILQLSPAALADCQLDKKFHFHRMAQVDCALQLLEINHRNLKPVVDEVFSNLPQEKLERLYALLLIQAYHGGVGRISELLNDPMLGKAAHYFAKHHLQYSAEDIALGIVFHNLGRRQLGFNSLYYVTDVGIAQSLVCETIKKLPGCESN